MKLDSVEITGVSVKSMGDGDTAQIGGITVKAGPDFSYSFDPPLGLLTVPAQTATGVSLMTVYGV